MRRLEYTGCVLQATAEEMDQVRVYTISTLLPSQPCEHIAFNGLSEKPVGEHKVPSLKYELRSSIHFGYRLRGAMSLCLSTRSHIHTPRLLYYHWSGSVLNAGIPYRFLTPLVSTCSRRLELLFPTEEPC